MWCLRAFKSILSISKLFYLNKNKGSWTRYFEFSIFSALLLSDNDWENSRKGKVNMQYKSLHDKYFWIVPFLITLHMSIYHWQKKNPKKIILKTGTIKLSGRKSNPMTSEKQLQYLGHPLWPNLELQDISKRQTLSESSSSNWELPCLLLLPFTTHACTAYSILRFFCWSRLASGLGAVVKNTNLKLNPR